MSVVAYIILVRSFGHHAPALSSAACHSSHAFKRQAFVTYGACAVCIRAIACGRLPIASNAQRANTCSSSELRYSTPHVRHAKPRRAICRRLIGPDMLAYRLLRARRMIICPFCQRPHAIRSNLICNQAFGDRVNRSPYRSLAGHSISCGATNLQAPCGRRCLPRWAAATWYAQPGQSLTTNAGRSQFAKWTNDASGSTRLTRACSHAEIGRYDPRSVWSDRNLCHIACPFQPTDTRVNR